MQCEMDDILLSVRRDGVCGGLRNFLDGGKYRMEFKVGNLNRGESGPEKETLFISHFQ